MANQTIVSFIKNQTEKGETSSDIHTELVTKGWDEKDVNDAFREVRGEAFSSFQHSEINQSLDSIPVSEEIKSLVKMNLPEQTTTSETTTTITTSEDLTQEQKDTIENSITNQLTEGILKHDNSTKALKITTKETAWLTPTILFFIFGGLPGAIVGVFLGWRVSSILKSPTLTDQEKKTKIITTYIITISAALILSAAWAALSATPFVKEILNTNF